MTTDQKIDKVLARLDHIDSRLGGIDSRLDKIDSRLESIESTQAEHTATLAEHSVKLDAILEHVPVSKENKASMDKLKGKPFVRKYRAI